MLEVKFISLLKSKYRPEIAELNNIVFITLNKKCNYIQSHNYIFLAIYNFIFLFISNQINFSFFMHTFVQLPGFAVAYFKIHNFASVTIAAQLGAHSRQICYHSCILARNWTRRLHHTFDALKIIEESNKWQFMRFKSNNSLLEI